jgi:Spy/CpxP family protein refolding chaperone
MTMKNTDYAMMTILTVLLTACVALGQESNTTSSVKPPPGGPGMWGGMGQGEGDGLRADMMLERILTNADMIAKIGLSDDQAKTLNTAIADIKSKRATIKSQMDALALEQVTKMAQTNVDEKAVLKLVEQIGELRTQIAKSAISELLLIKRTVTPEQMKKMREIARDLRKDQRRPDGRERPWERDRKSEDKGTTNAAVSAK